MSTISSHIHRGKIHAHSLYKHIFSGLKIVNISLIGLFLTACQLQIEEPITTATSHQGSVGDGPIIQANIDVKDANGLIVNSTTSNVSASYTVVIPVGSAYPVLIKAVGGLDVVTNMAPDFDLVSVATDPAVNTVNINPFSTLIVKTAQAMPGGLTDENVSLAKQYTLGQFSFGLDRRVMSDPITTPINEANVAAIIKSSEAFGETIRRARSALQNSNLNLTEDQIIDTLAADLTDGVIDGIGLNANNLIAATINIVAGQVVVEALANHLNVGGTDSTSRMNSAINLSVPNATMTTADVIITDGMLTQARKAVAAAQAHSPSNNLSAVAVILAGLSGNVLAADIDAVLPANSSSYFDGIISQISLSTDNQLELVNAAIRNPAKTIRVNAGGDKYVDTAGNIWSSDIGFNTGSSFSWSDPINGTADDILLQSERWDPIGGEELKYSFAVPNGNYNINLYFADRLQNTGARVFDIQIGGQTVQNGFDIVSEVGSNTAVRKSYQATVFDGQIDISFMHDIENPKISAIEILPQPGQVTTVIPGTIIVGGATASGTTASGTTASGTTTSGTTTSGTTTSGTTTSGTTTSGTTTSGTTTSGTTVTGGAPLAKLTYSADNGVILNPERGFHGNSNLLVTRNFSDHIQRGHVLTRSYIRLDAYRNSAIPASLIADLENGLEALRSSQGVKVILRFTYNFGKEADATKERILQHIQQLQPTFRKYEDVIYIVQAGFIGAWGEWHTSTNGLSDNPAEQGQILEALLDALPSSMMTQVRKPHYKLAQYPELTANQAFNGSYAARIGIQNDCFAYDSTDRGTYVNKPVYPSRTTPEWKQYIANNSLYTPLGGEMCEWNAGGHRLDQAVTEMEQQHWTWANGMGNPDSIAYIKSIGAYDVMIRKLGYRFRLNEANVPAEVKPGGHFNLGVKLVNEGWGVLVYERPLFVVLDNGVNRYQVKLDQIDARKWKPGTNVSFAADLELPAGIPNGNYKVALWMPDSHANLSSKPAFSIHFANNNVWDASKGYNVLGNVNVSNNASGTQNSSATNFRVLSYQ